jgi:DNA-binding response OmpR family regulator
MMFTPEKNGSNLSFGELPPFVTNYWLGTRWEDISGGKITTGVRVARILIIDDEPAVRRPVRKMLEIPGHEVEEVEDGLLGIALHAMAPFDVIITDLHMPRCDGLEVIRNLRQIGDAVGVILLSGQSEGESHAITQELGAVWILSKPFTVEQLQTLVHQISSQSSRP